MCAVMAGRSLPGPSPLGDSLFAESRHGAGSAVAERLVHDRSGILSAFDSWCFLWRKNDRHSIICTGASWVIFTLSFLFISEKVIFPSKDLWDPAVFSCPDAPLIPEQAELAGNT